MKKIVIGNWKMYKNISDIVKFNEELNQLIDPNKEYCTYGICVPSIYLSLTKFLFKSNKNILIMAQDAYFEKEGAFTGNVSWSQLKDCNVIGSIVGHSERRQLFNDTDEVINKKTKALVSNDMLAILCVGETISEYENGLSKKVVLNQIEKDLANISLSEIDKVIIAYEPIWAIGTGKVPTPEYANDLIASIREKIASLFSDEISKRIPILYGGSVNPSNIKNFLSTKNIDGALVGSASLEASKFFGLVKEGTF